jgi:hypothetical protein
MVNPQVSLVLRGYHCGFPCIVLEGLPHVTLYMFMKVPVPHRALRKANEWRPHRTGHLVNVFNLPFEPNPGISGPSPASWPLRTQDKRAKGDDEREPRSAFPEVV